MKRILRLNAGKKIAGLSFATVLLVSCVSVSAICHAQTISGGTAMKVTTGTVVSSDNPMNVMSGGTLDVQGTLVLKKNLVNQNATATSLGNGVIELSGTTAQTVSGQNIIGTLRINNAAGVVISGDTRVNDSLNLKSGLVTLGSNHLTLSDTALCSAGSSSAMVVVTGTGEFRKSFPTSPSFPVAFTYPVGDATGTTEYSPVSVNFTGGTFGTGNYLGVTLQNAPDPDPNIASGNYINRYWVLNNNAISGTISCGVTMNFLDADVQGTKASLYGEKTSPTLETFNGVSGNTLTGTVSSFGRFTGSDPAFQTSLTVFLQGAYNSTYDQMTDSLTVKLPLGDRGTLTNFPWNQPYNGSPWNYTGTESVTSLPSSDITDWVLVELRQATIPDSAKSTHILATRAGFLKQNGSVVDVDGNPLKFYHTHITQNLYPVIRHRNHMAIMAASAVTKNSSGLYAYDYSTASTQVWGGTAGMKQIDTSPVRWGMISGDANADNHIWNNDYTSYYLLTFYIINQYRPADFNLDGKVWNNDYVNYYLPNFYISNLLP